MRRLALAESVALPNANKCLNGFTLIELMIVVVIIAILAAIAIPNYLSLTRNARIASLQYLAGQVSAVSTAASAQCYVTPGCFGTGVTWLLTVGTSNIQMWNGYPDAGDTLGNDEIDMLIKVSSDFTAIIIPQNLTLWQLNAAPTPANCAVQYQEATSITNPPVVSLITSGC